MTDTFAGTLTAFDAVAITLVLISGLMGLARGFIRELATLAAFIAAVAAAYFARLFLRGPLVDLAGDALPAWGPDAILMLGTFGIVYVALSMVGSHFARHVHTVDGVSLVNRIVGLLFGLARGLVVMVAFVLVVTIALPQERIPRWIAEARLYPIFADWAEAARGYAPKLADTAGSIVTPQPADPAPAPEFPQD